MTYDTNYTEATYERPISGQVMEELEWLINKATMLRDGRIKPGAPGGKTSRAQVLAAFNAIAEQATRIAGWYEMDTDDD